MTTHLDLSGKRFGSLTVIKEAGRTKANKSTWLVKCDCGNEKVVVGGSLVSGLTKTCSIKGCPYNLSHDRHLDKAKEHIGRRYGHLIVTGVPKQKQSRRIIVEVLCDCGAKKTIELSRVTSGHTQTCGCMMGRDYSKPIGAKNKNYLKGFTTDTEGYNIRGIDGRSIRYNRWLYGVFLGRPVLDTDKVHHINGLKNDDRIDNYILFKDTGEHLRHHIAYKNRMAPLNGRRIFITGGAGYLGLSLAKHLYYWTDSRIVIYSRDDAKHEKMRDVLTSHRCDMSRFDFYVGDIRNMERLTMAMKGCDLVIHAAAWKIIPSAERDPMECISTNVVGSENVIKAALSVGAKKCVAISTDKAAGEITNVYGHSKKLMEGLWLAANNYNKAGLPEFLCVRYGNVAQSTSSIIPRMQASILANGCISVTDPDMTRFWMTSADAVENVMEALLNGKPGDIIVKKSPSIRIGDLAKAFQDISGCTVDTIGKRDGERDYEALISDGEGKHSQDTGDFIRFNNLLISGSGPFRSDKNTFLDSDYLRRYLTCDRAFMDALERKQA